MRQRIGHWVRLQRLDSDTDGRRLQLHVNAGYADCGEVCGGVELCAPQALDLRPRSDLHEFVALYNPANRHQRKATWSAETPDGRWRVYEYDELIARDKASLDIFWLKDDSLADSDNLPPPEAIAQEVVEDLEAALEQFRLIAGELGSGNGKVES